MLEIIALILLISYVTTFVGMFVYLYVKLSKLIK